MAGDEYIAREHEEALNQLHAQPQWWRNQISLIPGEEKIAANASNRGYAFVQRARFITPQSWINPGDEIKFTQIIELPVPRYPTILEVRAVAILGRRDRMRLDDITNDSGYSWITPNMSTPQEYRKIPALDFRRYDFEKMEMRVHENNAIAEITREPRYLTIWRYINQPDGTLYYTVARKGEEDRRQAPSDRREASDRYGLVLTDTSWNERSLWNLK